MKIKKFTVAALALTMALSATTAFAATPVYEYSFDGTLGGAQVATREGDVDGLPVTPNVPQPNANITAQFAEGVNGQALFLDSTYGVILDAKAVGDTYSVAFWINPDRFSNYGSLVQIGQDLLEEEGRCSWLNLTKTDWVGDMAPVVWSRSQKASLELGDDPDVVWPWYQTAHFAAADNPLVLERKAWTHVAITVDGNTVGVDANGEEIPGTHKSKLYINGELLGEGAVAKYTFTDDSKIYLGINCWDQLMKGYFDDFKVYDVVLTAEDVKVAMNEPAGGAVEEVKEEAPAPAETSTPKTGVVSLGLAFGLSAAALGAGAVVLKKKEER